MNKKEQRKKIKDLFLDFTDNGYSEIICQKAFDYLSKRNISTVMSYCPFQKEVNVSILNEMLLKNNVIVGFPVISDKDYTMDCYYSRFYSLNQYGIIQPEKDKFIDKSKIDAVIVPLLAFDEQCFRLGRGKGYYDRYLSDYDGLKIALAYQMQMINKVVVDNYDVQMDVIISEKRVYEREN